MRQNAVVLLLVSVAVCFAESEKTMLFRKPTVSRTHIVFSYADDLWIVAREGGEATRLTAAPGVETNPMFSPDGSQIAFTGQYDGNTDVFVVPAAGGVPRRLTYHPGADVVVGWTPDGKQVIFRSGRNSYAYGFDRLFTMPLDGGFPAEIPLPRAEEGSYSADGNADGVCAPGAMAERLEALPRRPDQADLDCESVRFERGDRDPARQFE